MSRLAKGTRLGPFEVLDLLGSGGMGEVYRAVDTRLKRHVALKVLPAAVTGDPDRLTRFQREAEVLAALNHPNIGALHGFEESRGLRALVMELIDGPTLGDRIAAGPIPVSEALAIARQIAEGLEAAHEQNIIHRDLKPANIKLRHDGSVKILDFGLAKAMDPAVSSAGSSMSPTITSPAQMTAAGIVLGTAAYMSPEQASGRPVDRRTDLWAFGVVLFEMLTGRRLFDGESVSHVIAAVLKDEPDWSALPPDTPINVRKLLRRCLEKDRRKRLADAATARLECDDAIAFPRETLGAAAKPAASRSPRLWLAAGGVAIGAVVAAVIALMAWPAPSPPVPSVRFAIELPAEQVFTRTGRHVIALSSDASRLVYVANARLYLRSFAELSSAPIDGTANTDPSQPMFSPDGQWIAFWSNGILKKVPTAGGAAVSLAELPNPNGMSWHGDRILAAVESQRAIVEVPANGGAPRPLLQLDAAKGELPQSPQLIDDGRAVLMTVRSDGIDWDNAAIVVHDLATGARTTLIERGTDGRLVGDRQLLYSRAGTLFAVAFEAKGRAVSGRPVPLQQKVLQSVGGFSGASHVAHSANGTLAFVPGDNFGSDRELRWMTRAGVTRPTSLPARPVFPADAAIALSPNGRHVALRMLGASTTLTDIWVGDLSRDVYTRLSSTGTATDPVWTPDGTRVCYENRDTVLCQPPDGSAPGTGILTRPGLGTVAGWSRDGRSLLLTVSNPKTGFDLWLATNKPPFEATALIATPENDDSAVLSPDGKWIAHVSEDSGTDNVYVRPFPAVNQGRWQVSIAGGVAPRWSRDSRELYYLATRTAGSSIALTLMAARVQPGTAFATTPPQVVAPLPFGVRGYDTAPDGRFLISVPVGASVAGAGMQRQTIVVIQNWPDVLRSQQQAGASR